MVAPGARGRASWSADGAGVGRLHVLRAACTSGRLQKEEDDALENYESELARIRDEDATGETLAGLCTVFRLEEVRTQNIPILKY